MFGSLKKIAFIIGLASLDIPQVYTQVLIDSLIREAIQHHPKIHAIQHNYEAYRFQAKQKRSWPAPDVGFELFQMPASNFPIPVKGNMETDYFIQQMIPWPGKLDAMSEAAHYTAEIQKTMIASAQLNIERDARVAFFELCMINERRRNNANAQRTLEQLLQLSLKRYEVGQITQADILQIENERLALENKAFELEKDRRVTESMLNGVLGNNEIRWPDSIPVDWTNNFSVVLDTLIHHTLPKKPEIQGMNHEIAMFTAEKKAAHREWFPDIMVRGMYKDMSMGKKYWSLMLSANIPFAPWSRGSLDARIKELDMHIKHGAMDIENMKIMITSEARSAIERIKSSRRQAEQIEQRILPHYEAAYQSMMISFQTGKADTAMLLSMLRMIYMAKDDLVMALAGSKIAEADFYKAIGMSNVRSEVRHD